MYGDVFCLLFTQFFLEIQHLTTLQEKDLLCVSRKTACKLWNVQYQHQHHLSPEFEINP